MEQNKCIGTKTSVLIALCNIFDEYSDFIEKLKTLTHSKHSIDQAFILDDISHGKTTIYSRKAHKFYKNNKVIIDKINEYSDIYSFINDSYDENGMLSEESDLGLFYKYMLKNKDKLEQIKSLIQKIKELGFENLCFEEFDEYTSKDYKVYKNLSQNIDITYLDNIKVIPNYRKDIITYITTGSNYKIRISEYRKSITLNSLIFDEKRLPDNISIEDIFDKIVKSGESQKENSLFIKDLIDLSVSIDDLTSEFKSTNRIIEKLDKVESKCELQKALLDIKNSLNELKKISDNYNDDITKNNPDISKEILEKEKELYLCRRTFNDIDID